MKGTHLFYEHIVLKAMNAPLEHCTYIVKIQGVRSAPIFKLKKCLIHMKTQMILYHHWEPRHQTRKYLEAHGGIVDPADAYINGLKIPDEKTWTDTINFDDIVEDIKVHVNIVDGILTVKVSEDNIVDTHLLELIPPLSFFRIKSSENVL